MAKRLNIKSAVKRPGRTRKMLGLKKGQKVTRSAVERKKRQLQKSGEANRSNIGALDLAERLIAKKGKGGVRNERKAARTRRSKK